MYLPSCDQSDGNFLSSFFKTSSDFDPGNTARVKMSYASPCLPK